MISFRLKLLAVATTLLATTAAFAETNNVTLAWDGTPKQDAGYILYWGAVSGDYDQQLDTSHNTSQTILNLTVGAHYYFAVAAYNQDGVESIYSEELSIVVPPPGSTPTPTPTPTPKPTPSPTPTATPSPTATPTATPSPTATPTPTPPPQYLLNISTRVRVRDGDHVMIGGFIIEGNVNKDVVLRALGPSLADLGVKHPLPDPKLEVYNSDGVMVQQNDNWTTLPPGTVPAGFEPPNPLEAAIVANLAPGSYTAILRSVDGSEGNALCELYDLTPGNSKVRNISTRGEVGVGDDVMIGGFIVGGTAPSKIMVRAIGPSLAAFGVTGVLPDPVLELHDQDGSLIYLNDNWRGDQGPQILSTALQPSDERESAIIATLAPGAYTAIVSGAGNAQGVALVEVYVLDQ